MMSNRTISLCTVVVTVLWLSSITLAIFNLFVGPDLSALSVLCGIAAAVLTVRAGQQRDKCEFEMAYELGQQSAVRRVK